MYRLRLFAVVAAVVAFSSAARAGDLPPVSTTPDMTRLDADRDGRVDLTEAHFAAHFLWDRISPEWWLQTEVLHSAEGTLKDYELIGRLEGDDYAAINANNDHGIEMAEWLIAVDARFEAADRNHDDSVDGDEFSGESGIRLLQVLQ